MLSTRSEPMLLLAFALRVPDRVTKGCYKYCLVSKGDLAMSQTKGVKLDDIAQRRLAALDS